MHTVLVSITAIALVIGSLLGAAALCWLLWHVFVPIRHPELAASVILVLVVLALTNNLPNSELLHMALAFAAIAVAPLWIEGRAWRRDHASGRDLTNGAGAPGHQ